jgi:hypothetical protein
MLHSRRVIIPVRPFASANEKRIFGEPCVIDLRPPLIPAGGMSMYKTLCAIALLLGTFALTGSQSAAVPAATSAPIIARVALTNQTATIPKTTIFTPTQSGIYRVSPYMGTTQPNNNGFWYFDFYWTDDGGTRSAGQMLSLGSQGFGQDPNGSVVGSFTFRAIAGQPVSYDVSACCGASGAYELFFVVERVE